MKRHIIPTYIPAPKQINYSWPLSKTMEPIQEEEHAGEQQENKKHKSRFDTPNNWLNHEQFDYFKDEKMQKIIPGYQGLVSCCATDLINTINITKTSKPINYLQVGEIHGSMFCSFIKLFFKHNLSNFYLIEPFVNDETGLYTYNENLKLLSSLNPPFYHLRTNIYNTLTKCIDLYYDFIFIQSKSSLKDDLETLVLSWRKLKRGGILVFSTRNEALDFFQTHWKDEFIKNVEVSGMYLFVKRM